MSEIENNETKSSPEENLLGVAQRILGNIETVGGILTGDPAAAAEGEFNANMGAAHQESNRSLMATDRAENKENKENA